MFFNGGMIPTYLIIQKLGMLNKIWALVLPSAISTYNMIIMRTFFENTIPNELIEAAALDGCNDITTFFRIVLPLSGAVFAVMGAVLRRCAVEQLVSGIAVHSGSLSVPFADDPARGLDPKRHRQHGRFHR